MNALDTSSTPSNSASSMHDILTQLNLLQLEKQFADEQIDVDSLVRLSSIFIHFILAYRIGTEKACITFNY